ncbi:unnamed protein product [Brassica oleracea var. botrytis]|uniref:(rape) hypothetical protein n=1 Tax=Brassica napus TaxID=3708 RepID=A0A816IIP0_BRANA|nr:unnamed protein product [Brassica napus]
MWASWDVLRDWMFNDLQQTVGNTSGVLVFGMRSISDIVTIRPDQYKTRELNDLKSQITALDRAGSKIFTGSGAK